jgi:hypothetical protein
MDTSSTPQQQSPVHLLNAVKYRDFRHQSDDPVWKQHGKWRSEPATGLRLSRH